MTATEEIRKAQDENRLHREIEYFIHTNAPSDPQDRARFEAGLIRIVHIIHSEASKPFLDAISRGMALQPIIYKIDNGLS